MESVKRIVDAWQKVQSGEVDPFSVDVPEMLINLNRSLPDRKTLSELVPDAQAINAVSGIVGEQGRQVDFLASSAALTPYVVEKAIENASLDGLAHALWDSASPCAELPQLTTEALLYSLTTWKPPSKRKRWTAREFKVETTSIATTQDFTTEVSSLVSELRARGVVDYSNFIKEGDPIRRAYALSFAITYGLVDVKVDPITRAISIAASSRKLKTSTSLVIPLEEYEVE